MKIVDEIISPFEIHMDDDTYIIVEKKIRGEESKSPGDEFYVNVKYYSNIEQSIKPLSRLLLARQGREVTLVEFLSSYKKIIADIESVIKKAGF